MLLAQHDKETLLAVLNDIQCRHSELSANAVLLDAGRALSGLAKLNYIECEKDLTILKKEHFEDAGLSIQLTLSEQGRAALNL